MSAGDQMRAYYEQWRQRFPALFAVPLTVLPDSTTGYHITSGALNGIPQTQVQAGYAVAPWQAAHEILGHIALGLRPALKEPFWTTRFGACQYQVMPRTWAQADADSGYGTGGWAYLPIEVYAEAARLAYTTDGPTDRSMDWGCALNAAKMRTFLDSAYGAAISPPTLPPPQKGPLTIDLRAVLPFVGNVYGTFLPKSSSTFHWNGPPLPVDADPVDLLKADAAYHIAQGWGGISYHKAIWRDGTLYLTRDPAAVLAACGNALGNARSTHVQVMVGEGQAPTEAQLARMAELAAAETAVYPHRFWSATACPGEDIVSWIDKRGWEEDMTPEQSAKLDRVLALLEAREPLVWAARGQRFLDVERGTAYDPNKPPLDPRIKA